MGSLEEYRIRIHETDRKLISLIKERLTLGENIAQAKELRGLPIIDTDAEQATIDNLTNSAANLKIDPSFIRRLGELLIEQTIKVQDKDQPKQSKDLLFKEMFELTQKLMAQGRNVARFEVGEPNFAPHPKVIRGLTDAFRKKKIFGYGAAAGLPELRKALAEELSKQHNTTIDKDQILITPGGRFAIFATITSFVSQLERVIIPQPAWPAYEECVNFTKGRVIPLNTTLDDGWEIDLGKLETQLKKGVRMVIINTPNNPTGKVIGKKKFQEAIDLARRYDAMVLSDEVYEKYVRSESPSILESDYANSVYINSFSKQFGITGWRIAYLVTTKQNAQRIKRVTQTAVTCVPEFIQKAVLTAIKTGRGSARRNVDAIMRKVEFTCRELDKIDVSFYRPDGAFYVFPRANRPNFDSLKFARQLLEKHAISISPGQSFGEYAAFFRLAISIPKSEIAPAIKTIGKALDSWS